MAWRLWHCDAVHRDIHVTPDDDLIEHDINDDNDCICGPAWELTNGTVMYTHHSLDNREVNE